jgi:Putative zinc-finger
LRALTLLAEGYSYREIGEITGFSQTKINRCLAEGRERFRKFISRGEDGTRCVELQPLISAFCDGEAGSEEAATLREHLRACPQCRATLRAYRAAPAAAAALAPALPLGRGLLDRAHEAYVGLASRFGGGGAGTDSALTQIATAGGTRGAGMAALAKLAAVCVGTVGGAAACVATGVVPAPLEIAADQHRAPRLERPAASTPATEPGFETGVDYESEPSPSPSPAEEKPPKHHDPPPAPEPSAAPVPESSGGAVEYTPPPAPTSTSSSTAAAPTSSGSSGGDPAGEFGP